MNLYILSATAILTLVLNFILTVYLLKKKNNVYSNNANKKEIINFVLTPSLQNKILNDSEALATEIISPGDNHNG